MTKPVYTVSRVPNKRKPGQTMLTFWLPDAEAEAAKEAIAQINAANPDSTDITISSECRRALRNTVQRAGRLGRAEKKDTDQ